MITLVIPCRNEYGTISDIINFSINLPGVTQILVVDGNSSDKTLQKAQETCRELLNVTVIKIDVLEQVNVGKWDAVLLGIQNAENGYISIWDADLTVSFSEQALIHERFISSIKHRGIPCLAMGERMTQREPGSMRFFNLLGNLLFAKAWSLMCKTDIKDMLCGSKVFESSSLSRVPSKILRGDPYGDFSIVFASVLSGYNIETQTLTYRARTYGQTNILRWSGAYALLKVTLLSLQYLRNKNVNRMV
jgi:glycosyltransferase involved in cell wall biosynthesis